jgi:cytochrome P450 family 9
MGFIGYEITANPEVQDKLFAEIQEMEQELDGKMINYEQIQSMKYMDQVVCETLRKWPAAPVRNFMSFHRLTISLIFLTI